MEITKLSTKGQVIVPKTIRDARGWQPGTEFLIEDVAGGILLRPVRPLPPSRLEDVSGALHYTGRPKSIAAMKRAIAREVRERHGRGRY
jgi:AbrB family looped-hinge helix DNA binding protein